MGINSFLKSYSTCHGKDRLNLCESFLKEEKMGKIRPADLLRIGIALGELMEYRAELVRNNKLDRTRRGELLAASIEQMLQNK